MCTKRHLEHVQLALFKCRVRVHVPICPFDRFCLSAMLLPAGLCNVAAPSGGWSMPGCTLVLHACPASLLLCLGQLPLGVQGLQLLAPPVGTPHPLAVLLHLVDVAVANQLKKLLIPKPGGGAMGGPGQGAGCPVLGLRPGLPFLVEQFFDTLFL